MKVFLVGGAVRDRLLGRPVKDRDYVVVGATPEEMRAQGFRQVGADFPVFLHPDTHCEYALARTERKSGSGYRGFVVHADPHVTLEQDLARRDVTINAMAEGEDGTLYDPYGGQRDLEARVLRHVSPAFVEDPLRVLRVARFAARLGFAVADETRELMRTLALSGELASLAPERIWTEVERALADPWPARFIEVLRECAALAQILPEVDALFGVPQPPAHHPEIDTGAHTLLALAMAAQLSPDARVRFAVLVHDLGKAATPQSEWPRHRGHEQRGVPLVTALAARLRIPREYAELARLVTALHLQVHRALELRPETVLDTLDKLDGWRRPERVEPFLLACEADARGRAGLQQRAYPQAEYLRAAWTAARAVDTRAIAQRGLPGPAIAASIRRGRLAAVQEFVHARRAGGGRPEPDAPSSTD